MIKTLLTAALLIGFSAMGQSQNLWSIYAGPQYSGARYKVRDTKQEVENKWGAQLGASLKIPFDNQLFFTPHAYYSMKGFRVALKDPSFPPGEDAVGNDISVHVIELAPLLQIDFSKNASHPFVRFGPAVDVAVSGKEKISLNSGRTTEQNMVFSFSNYGRITSSAVAHMGYEWAGGFYFYGQLSYGLGSMNNADQGPKIRHTVFGISIGKYFGHNPNIMDTRVLEK